MSGIVPREEVAVGPEPGGDGVGGNSGSREALAGTLIQIKLDEEVGDDVGGDGVGAEDEPGPEDGFANGVGVQAADVDEPVAEGEEQERPSGGVEDIGAGPEVFVEGEGAGPEEAGGERR